MPFVMFEKQEEFCHFVAVCMEAQASGLIEKSRDMGATWVGVGLTVHMWLFWDGSATGWGSQAAEKVDRLGDPSSVFEKIRMAIRGVPDIFKPKGFDESDLNFMRLVNRETGATVVGEIGDNIGRGGRTGVYFVDEAAHLQRPEKVEASLLETTRVRMDISSVSGLGTVFHRKREAGLDWAMGQKCDPFRTNVFVMDWSDHPAKSKDWYTQRKNKLKNDGLGHVFAREIDRDYSAAVEGVIIPQEHVEAAINAHLTLNFEDDGAWAAAMDVADGGLDRNAFARRRGVILKHLAEWSERDPGLAARKVISLCRDTLPCKLEYDSIGVGATVKSEINRLRDDDMQHAHADPTYQLLIPRGLTFSPWSAAAKVQNPEHYMLTLPNGQPDKNSPKNKNFFANLKAQGWWELARRFERTFMAITDKNFTWVQDDLISIDTSGIPPELIAKLKKELSQPTASRTTSLLKLVVDKAPEGTRSPNLGDACMMCYWPVVGMRGTTASLAAPIVISGD